MSNSLRTALVAASLALAGLASAHAADAPAAKPHTARYECAKDANQQGLKDDARKSFIKDCVAKKKAEAAPTAAAAPQK
ncbi:PsiF family protein, partial [Derxia gummosa]|uniref:PsiF family protein n=1 Tax=Derxia gummosa DSM 723 TaxID=1121388 RepID=A0A9B0AH53_9BURK